SDDGGPALELEGVRVGIPVGPERTIVALDGLDARIRCGEMLGVRGSNGAGKSPLARVLCGVATATAGRARIGGADATGWPLAERAARLGFAPREPAQMRSQPRVLAAIALGLRARALPEEEIARRSEEVLEVCGLRPFRSWPLSALSHGQRKR